MTARDISMVLAGYDAISAYDLEGVLAVTASNGVLETRLETYANHEGMRRYFAEAMQAGFKTTQEALIVLDECVVGLSTIQLEGHAADMSADQRVAEIWRLEDGFVTHLRVLSRDEAIESFELERRIDQVARMRDGYDAFNRGDFEAVVAALSPDVEFNRGDLSMDTDLLSGREQMREYFEPNVFAEQRYELHNIVDADERVLVEGNFHARGSGSGIEIATPNLQVWTMRDGAAARADLFQTRAEALEFLMAPSD